LLLYRNPETPNVVTCPPMLRFQIVTYNGDGEEVVKAIFGKGEIFGEKALLGEEKRSDYAMTCMEPTVLCPMKLSNMYQLMRNNEKIGFFIFPYFQAKCKHQSFYSDKDLPMGDNLLTIYHLLSQKDVFFPFLDGIHQMYILA